MKYLITSGCSFTSSARVNYHRSDDTFLRDDKQMWYYPHWLQRTLPDIKIYNMGSPGNNNSMIVRSALYKAKELELTSIALLGKGGGNAVNLADLSIVVDSEETARIQEVHLLLGHTLCEYAEIYLGIG